MRSGAAEGLEDSFLAGGLSLLRRREGVTVATAYGLEPEDKVLAETGDTAFDDGGTLRALAEFESHAAVDASLGILIHHLERLLDALFGNNFEKRRLLELNGESL